MSKTARKLTVLLLVAVLLITSFVLAACRDDEPEPEETFAVTYMVDGTQFKKVDVKKNTRLTKPDNPTYTQEGKVFVGWYTDENYTTEWNFSIGIVSKDMSLYALSRTISAQPSSVAMSDEACTSALVWTQSAASDATSYQVTITNVKGGTPIELQGTVTYDASIYQVTFRPSTIPQGGRYNVSVKDTTKTAAAATANDLLFCGEGTQANPYLIGSANDFTAISQANVAQGVVFSMAKNIVISPFRDWQKDYVFNGTLLGNGRTITLENANCGAIYKIGAQGSVRQLNLTGTVTTVKDSVGGLADFNLGTIEKVTAALSVESTSGLVGSSGYANCINAAAEDGSRGIAGLIAGTNEGTINNCKVTVDGAIKANIAGGGIAGYNKGTISNCTFAGVGGAANAKLNAKSVSKYSYMGLIAGINEGNITKCEIQEGAKLLAQRYTNATLVVEGTNNSYCGGIVGYNKGSASSVSECSFAGMRIHGDQYIGGIAGANEGTIANCGVYGVAVTVNSTNIINYIAGRLNVGGIAGDNTGTVTKCFVTANVFGFTSGSDYYVIAKDATNSVYLATEPNAAAEGALALTASIAEDYSATAGYNEKDNLSNRVVPTDAASIVITNDSGTVVKLNADVATALGDRFFYDAAATQVRLVYVKDILPEETVNVELYTDDGYLWKTVEVAESPAEIEGPYKLYSVLKGWASTANGELIFAATTKISLYDLQDYADAEGKFKLYAIQEARPAATKLVVAIWDRYVNETQLSTIKSAFEARLAEKGLTVEVEYRHYASATSADPYYAVANFGGKVNEEGDVDVIIGSGTNIGSTGGVVIFTRSSIATYVEGREAALITDSSFATEFFAFITGATSNDTCQVTLVGDNTTVNALNSLLRNEAIIPTVTVAEGYEFKGWATTENATAAQVVAETIQYATVADLLTEGAVTLYPVIVEIVTAPEYETIIKIGVWHNEYGWVTQDELAKIKSDVVLALASAGYDVSKVGAEFVIYNQTAVADLGAAVIADGDIDVILGCGGNVGTKGGVTYIGEIGSISTDIVAAGRKVVMLKDNLYAQTIYNYLINGLDEAKLVLNVAVWTKNGDWVTEAELDAIKALFEERLEFCLIDVSKVTINYTEITTADNKVAGLGALTNEGTYDIVLGCGNNVDSTGGVTIIQKASVSGSNLAEGKRVIARLTDNGFALLFYGLLALEA